MENAMNKNKLVTTFFGLLAILLCATQLNAANEINFSLHNKSKHRITFEIRNPKLKGGVHYVTKEPGGFADLIIDTSKETRLIIFSPKLEADVTFTLNKDIYVNFNDEHQPKLYHQRGPLMGLLGKIDQGYSTANNVSDSDIKPRVPLR